MKTCTFCGKAKEVEEFGFRNKAAGKRHEKCKVCVAEAGRAHYERNRQAYISRSAHNTRLRRRLLQDRVWSYLLEHKCVDCEEQDPLVLDFDHLDSNNKSAEIYQLIRDTCRWSVILDELNKCDVRCANCHRRRTSEQFSWTEPSEPLFPQERIHRRQLRRPLRRPRVPADLPFAPPSQG